MTTSARAPRLDDLGTPPFANSSVGDTSASHRPALLPTLSSNSVSGLGGIWANDSVGGLAALRRGSADDNAPTSRQGSSSLLPASGSDAWSRRGSQWSAVAAPTYKPLDNATIPRRDSTYPSTSAADLNLSHDSRRQPRHNSATASFGLRDAQPLSNGHYKPRIPESGAQTLSHTTNSWIGESHVGLESRAWPGPQKASLQKPAFGSSVDTGATSNLSNSRWNGQFGVPARPSLKSNTVPGQDQNDFKQLSMNLNRLKFEEDDRPGLIQSGRHPDTNAAYRLQNGNIDMPRHFPQDWSYPQAAGGDDWISAYDDPTPRPPERSRPSTSHFGEHRDADYLSGTQKHYQLSAASNDFSPTDRDLQHLRRAQVDQFARPHTASALDYMYSDSHLRNEDDQHQLAMWSAGMYTRYNYPQYRFPPTRPGAYGMPLPANLPGWMSSKPYPLISPLNNGQDIASSLMMEFHRSNAKGGRRYELRDIFDHIVEFAGDQHGSRFIQQKLETANSDDKNRVFLEIQPNAIQLMKDVFGNYVIQKFFEHGDQTQKKILASCMQGQVLDLSLNVYGCRVVQKALEHVLVDQQASMVAELYDHVLRCVRDQNGNHVIQMAIQKVPGHHIGFIIDAFIGQVQNLATHSFGCRVVQRLLEYCEEPARSMLLRELHDCALTLICDQYGNYVTQHVIEHGRPEDRRRLIGLVKDHLIPFSKQKYASNVVEKVIVHGTDEDRHAVMMQFAQRDERGETALPFLLKDGYGNYVIQKLLDTLTDADHHHFIKTLEPELRKARCSGPNKQVENVAKKMCRNGPGFFTNHRHDPAGPTPPMTAHGTPSPQSSSLPSTVGGSGTTSNGSESRKHSTPTVELPLLGFA